MTEKEEVLAQLSERYNDVVDTVQLQEKYEVLSFLAPFVMVKRKDDGVLGTMMFTHMPRFYYNFCER